MPQLVEKVTQTIRTTASHTQIKHLEIKNTVGLLEILLNWKEGRKKERRGTKSQWSRQKKKVEQVLFSNLIKYKLSKYSN